MIFGQAGSYLWTW